MNETEHYKFTKVGTDVTDDYFDAWVLKDQRWNGWAIPLFPKHAVLEMMNAYNDETGNTVALEYDEASDTVKEVFNPNWHESPEEVMEWKGGFNEELGMVTYAVGAGYWTWSEIRDEE